MEIGEDLRWKIKKNENGKLGERELGQMGNHEDGIIGKMDNVKREIGKKENKENLKFGNWEKENYIQ